MGSPQGRWERDAAIDRGGAPRLARCSRVAVLALLAAPAAQATFHLIKVREVYPGHEQRQLRRAADVRRRPEPARPATSMTVYNATGTAGRTPRPSPPRRAPKPQTSAPILIGDTGVAGELSAVAPDLVDSEPQPRRRRRGRLLERERPPGRLRRLGQLQRRAALQTATGTGAGSPVRPRGITAGKAIRRSIAPGCPTLLEESDDTDVSSADFSEVTPRARATTPAAVTETTCAGAPNTAIDDKPALRTRTAPAPNSPTKRRPRPATNASSTRPPSPLPEHRPGIHRASPTAAHTFQVRGVNVSGPDPTPASYTWTVDTVAADGDDRHPPGRPQPGRQRRLHLPRRRDRLDLPVQPRAGSDNRRPSRPAPRGQDLHKASPTASTSSRSTPQTRPATSGAPARLRTGKSTTRSPTRRRRRRRSNPRPPTRATARPRPSPTRRTSPARPSNARSTAPPSPPARPAGSPTPASPTGPTPSRSARSTPANNIDPTPAGYSFRVVASRPPPAHRTAARSTTPPPPPTHRRRPRHDDHAKAAAKTHDRTPTLQASTRATPPAPASSASRRPRAPSRPAARRSRPRQLTFGHHTISGAGDRRRRHRPDPGAGLAFKVVRGP